MEIHKNPNAWMAEDAFGMPEADSGGAGKNIHT